MSRENYDPNQPVCNNQDDFNQALKQGLKYVAKEEMKKSKPWVYIWIVILTIFFIWAIMIAMQMPQDQRVLHLVLAMVASPIYVLAYYLGGMDNMMSGSVMSMGSCGARY